MNSSPYPWLTSIHGGMNAKIIPAHYSITTRAILAFHWMTSTRFEQVRISMDRSGRLFWTTASKRTLDWEGNTGCPSASPGKRQAGRGVQGHRHRSDRHRLVHQRPPGRYRARLYAGSGDVLRAVPINTDVRRPRAQRPLLPPCRLWCGSRPTAIAVSRRSRETALASALDAATPGGSA